MNKFRSNHIFRSASRLAMCLVLLFVASSVCAQQKVDTKASKNESKTTQANENLRQISGVVVDAATLKAIPGVSVQALNNRKYTAMTDATGTYTISVPDYVTSLYVFTPDYISSQIVIKGTEKQDVKLYKSVFRPIYEDGTQIHDVSKMTVENTSSLTIENEIENTLASSVRTIGRGGMPAQGAVMFINGLNSLHANAQPLVVIDGVLQDMQYDRTTIHDGFINNVFSIVDPEDIETVEVIKNGTALYGARGGNGVLKITTRRGKSMVTRIKIRAFGGFELMPSKVKMMDASQYRSYVTGFLGTTKNADLLSSSQNIPFMNEDRNYLFYDLYHNNTDWQDNLYRTAFTQNYKVGVEGGDDVAMYNLTLGYANSKATAKENGFDRLNIRFNTDISMFKNFNTAIDIAYSRNSYDLRDNGWAENYSQRNISSPNVLGLLQTPFISPFAHNIAYQNGGLVLIPTDKVYSGKEYNAVNNPFTFASQFGSEYGGLVNPFWILQNGDGTNKNSQEQTQFNVNIAPRYRINKYLTIQDRFSYILNRANEKYFLPMDGTPKLEVEGLGEVQSVIKSQFSRETTLFNDFFVDWNRNYGAHSINILGGFRISSYSYSNSFLAGYNNNNDKMPNMRHELQYKDYGGANDRWTNIAYYLNASYNYKNTYFLDFITTLESSSRFGKEAKQGIKLFGVRWGIFPSLQAGWLMSSEKWFNVPFINYLKLTMGLESSGNDDINYYASRTYFQNVPFLDKATSLVLANIKNPTIQWETTRRFNLGFQSHMFDNRLSVAFNFYASRTSHLLTRKSVSDIIGLPFIWSNDGAMKNTGVELNVSGILINTKNWQWQAGFSLGHYKNEITELPVSSLNQINSYALDAAGNRIEGSLQQIHGNLNSVYGTDNILTAVGYAAGVFYGYQTAGVFSSAADAAAADLKYPTGLAENPYRNFKAGDVHFVDQNGDGWINEADRVVIGDPNPSIYGNIFSRLRWKNLTLDIIFKYSVGNDIYNYQRRQLESANNIWNQTTAVVNRWRYDGQKTDMPRAMASSNDEWVNNERFSDRWIEDGSYFKLKKLRITYDIPLNLSWLQGLSVFGEANNLFTITKYLGSDPEISCGNSVLYQGIDAGYLPSNRSFNLGVTINL